MKLLVIATCILLAANFLVGLYCCLIMASREDEEMERNQREEYDEPEEESNG